MRKIGGRTLTKVRMRLEEEQAGRLRKAQALALSRSTSDLLPGLSGGDEADQAHASIAEQLEHLELRRMSSAARAIEAALLTLEVGSYGICLSCSEPIPPRRLLAVPTAILCRECQEATESARTMCRA